MAKLPSHARVVIVGGGVMGCGVAYHLAHEGWRDIVLLEKAELTSGSTWHAAGQITHSTSSFSLGKCVEYNIGLYSGALEAETGQSVTWHGCGSFRLAYTTDEMDWLRHTLSVGRSLGFNIELVGPDRVAELHPFYNLDGVLGALHTPDDGHVDPSGVTQAMAAGARQLGATIVRRCRATNITRQGEEWLVETEQGAIRCEHVVNAGGTYARQMGLWSDLQLPMTSMTHHYFVTDPVPQFADLAQELPVIRDDKQVSGYIRMEQKRGLIGIYEKENPNSVWIDHCPWEAENELFAPDYDRIMPWLENALDRMPIFAELGISRDVHGAISHPPDGNPLVGPAPGARNYWCACGTQIGIGWGPGLTRALAQWMVHGAAEISMRDYDPRRFGPYAADTDWQVTKAQEDYCLRHEIPFPHFNRLAGRPIKTSPIYATLKDQGAVHEEVFGWERPRWFAPSGVAAQDIYSFKRSKLDDIIAGEVRACREAAGIMDISSFAKIEVTGADAAAFLDGLIPNRLPKVDRMALTHLLNRRGTIEAEITLMRFSPATRHDATEAAAQERFYIVCAAFFERRVMDHLAARVSGDVQISCKSLDYGALALQGPRSRDILGACTAADLSNAGFPWLSHREIVIAGHPVDAIRMSYGGELGWELHMPMDAVKPVYEALMQAGAPLGLRNYGSFAMNAMRMEKGFKGAGELTNEVTLPEADVMRFVKTDKDFFGKEPSLAQPRRWLCAYLEVEPDGVVDGHGGEAVVMDGRVIGSTSSMAFGPTLGKIYAFAYIKPDAAEPGTALEVIIHGTPRAARVLDTPAYDPASKLPRTDIAAFEAAE